MPTAFTLRLRPFRPWRPDTGQLHGLACALFERPGTDHDRHDKPFATWPVARDPADPHVGLLLRCSWLRDEPPPFDPVGTPTLRLGGATCALVDARQQQATCTDLATGPPATTATVTFRSPTYFAHNGGTTLAPEPRLIAGSWRRHWNQALPPGSPLHIDDDLWRQLHHAVRLGPYDLHTAELDSGRGSPRLGFVGTAILQLERGAPRQVRSAFATLVRYAPYCGTGAQTTHGFGATTTAISTATGATPATTLG